MLLASCLHHGGSSAPVTPATPPASVVATVADTDGTPLAGVSIRVVATGATAQSDALGHATIALPVGSEQVLQLHKDGFAERSDALTLPTGSTSGAFSAVLIARSPVIAIAGVETGGTFAGPDGAVVMLPANALVDAAGHVVTGNAECAITPLDVRTDLRAFPGRFEGIPDGAPRTPIVTWGTTEFVFTQNGQRLQLATGVSAAIVLPIYVPTNQDGSALAAAQELPLWSLDETSAIWRQEGTGTVVAASASPTGFALAASVAHFSWWNVDQARSLGNGNEPFHAHVVCHLAAEGGQPVRDLPAGTSATVRITVGDPSAPRATAVDVVPPAGADELIPGDVPVLLEADASFGTNTGVFVVAHGSLGATFPAAGAGVVEILLHAIEVPAPLIVSPFEGAATNSSAATYVEITLDGPRPDAVELTVDGTLLHTFDPQFFYRFFWDTSTVAEGTHALVATAIVQGARRPSGPRLVVVDRTPPQVVQILPTPGTEISGRPGLEVQFDEAVVPAPFRVQDVVALTSTNNGVVQRLAMTASQNGAETTLHVDPASPLPFGTVGLSWAGMRDAAGNAPALVAATWPFDRTPALPGLDQRSQSQVPIAVSSAGVPFVAHAPRPGELAVSRYDEANGVWIELPGPLNAGAITNGHVPSLAIDGAGAPVIVYSEAFNGGNRYVVARFDGGWQVLGTPLSAQFGDHVSDVAIDAQGRPVIALARNGLVDVRRYDENAHDFVSLGAPFSNQQALVAEVDIGLKADGNPVVAWLEGIAGSNAALLFAREFDGTNWLPLGGTLDSVPNATQLLGPPNVVVDGGTFYIAWFKRINTDNITVLRWNGSAWVDLAFAATAQPAPDSNFGKLGLALRNGQPMLAYSANTAPFVAVFDGTSWAPGIEAVGPTTIGAPQPLLAFGGNRTFLSHIGCCSSLAHVVEIVFP
ncbi:MAG: hypothetical protein U1E73_05920 [Planctomycetota bacterium]